MVSFNKIYSVAELAVCEVCPFCCTLGGRVRKEGGLFFRQIAMPKAVEEEDAEAHGIYIDSTTWFHSESHSQYHILRVILVCHK